MSDARKTTNAILELMDNEMLSARVIAEACLNYMSEAEVADMVRANDLTPFIEAMKYV